MFFAPKEIKTETGESLVYNLHRTMVSKEFTFDAAHHLFNYEGKCKSLHGHTYHLQIAVSGYLDERGLILVTLIIFTKIICNLIWITVISMSLCLI